jgi:hypothetical protein
VSSNRQGLHGTSSTVEPTAHDWHPSIKANPLDQMSESYRIPSIDALAAPSPTVSLPRAPLPTGVEDGATDHPIPRPVAPNPVAQEPQYAQLMPPRGKTNVLRSRNVYVAGFPPTMNQLGFHQLMAQFGGVESVRLSRQRDAHGHESGIVYGFALMTEEIAARNAIRALNNRLYEGDFRLQARLSTNDIKGAKASKLLKQVHHNPPDPAGFEGFAPPGLTHPSEGFAPPGLTHPSFAPLSLAPSVHGTLAASGPPVLGAPVPLQIHGPVEMLSEQHYSNVHPSFWPAPPPAQGGARDPSAPMMYPAPMSAARMGLPQSAVLPPPAFASGWIPAPHDAPVGFAPPRAAYVAPPLSVDWPPGPNPAMAHPPQSYVVRPTPIAVHTALADPYSAVLQTPVHQYPHAPPPPS